LSRWSPFLFAQNVVFWLYQQAQSAITRALVAVYQ
jgi:hypothetical protein